MLRPGSFWFKNWREVLGFIVYPSLPERIVYVVGDNGVEHYYFFSEGSGENEVYVGHGDKVAPVSLNPRCERDGTAGPRVVHNIGGNIWNYIKMDMAFNLPGIRGAATWWLVIWVLIFYLAIYVPGIFLVFSPPYEEMVLNGVTYKIIPSEWSPDPLKLAIWVVAFSYAFGYIIYNLFRFKDYTVASVVLLELPHKIGGTSFTIPAPVGSNISVSEFIRKLGKRGPIEFISESIEQLAATLNSLVNENRALRKQALDVIDSLKRVKDINSLETKYTAAQELKAVVSARPLLLIGIFVLGAIIGAIVGYFIGLNYEIEASMEAAKEVATGLALWITNL